MNRKTLEHDSIYRLAEQQATLASDRDLLESTANGDEEAFSELYHRYAVASYNYLLRLVYEEAEAEDLLQEVFVGVWRGAGMFRGQSSVKTWLFRIAHNQAVSWLRRNKRASLPIISPLRDELGLPADDNPERQAIQSFQSEWVHVALTQLSPKHRAVVELTFVHNFSYREIAEILRCPIGTVKSRMSYALRNLNRILKKMGFEEHFR